MKISKLIIASYFFLTACTSVATPEDEIRDTAMQWINGISKGDADYMVSLYDPEGILHGTVSPVLRTGSHLIREYFSAISDNPPKMFFVDPMHIRVFDDTAINTGNYGVYLAGADEPIIMRYSFVYHRAGDKWLIVDHHSSLMPE